MKFRAIGRSTSGGKRNACFMAAFSAANVKQALCASRRVMGNGIIENVTDIIYCHPERFDFSKTAKIAGVIGKLNQKLLDKERRYILIGPGRWGTHMPQLGIPVNWQQVRFSSRFKPFACVYIMALPQA